MLPLPPKATVTPFSSPTKTTPTSPPWSCPTADGRVKDVVRIAKKTGMLTTPFTVFFRNQTWIEIPLIVQSA